MHCRQAKTGDFGGKSEFEMDIDDDESWFRNLEKAKEDEDRTAKIADMLQEL